MVGRSGKRVQQHAREARHEKTSGPYTLITLVCPAPAAWSTATWGTVSVDNDVPSRSSSPATSSPRSRSSRLPSAHALAIAVVVVLSTPPVQPLKPVVVVVVTAMLLRVEAVHRVEPTARGSELQAEVCRVELVAGRASLK